MSQKPSSHRAKLLSLPEDDLSFESERPTLVDGIERHSIPPPSLVSMPKNRALLTVLSGPERGQVF